MDTASSSTRNGKGQQFCNLPFQTKEGKHYKCGALLNHSWRHIFWLTGSQVVKESRESYEARIRNNEATLIMGEVSNAISVSQEDEPENQLGVIVNMVDEIRAKHVKKEEVANAKI